MMRAGSALWAFAALAFASAGSTVAAATAPDSPPTAADEIVTNIDAHYLYAGGNSWRSTRRWLLAHRELSLPALRRRIEKIGDTDLRLLSPDEIKILSAETAGKRLGLGLVDFAISRTPDGIARIVAPLRGSPSARAGLRPGDLIVAIDGQAVRGLHRSALFAALQSRGPVRLVLRRGEHRFERTIRPTSAPLKPLYSTIYGKGCGRIAYIGIAQFTPGIGREVAARAASLQRSGAKAFVLDLRSNPGGLLDEAASVARVFGALKPGQKERASGAREPIQSDAPNIVSEPVLTVVDRGTASAAEFVAAALKAMPMSYLIGDRTNGRAQAQLFVPLKSGWGIVIPSARLVDPNGALLTGKSIIPATRLGGGTEPTFGIGPPIIRYAQRLAAGSCPA